MKNKLSAILLTAFLLVSMFSIGSMPVMADTSLMTVSGDFSDASLLSSFGITKDSHGVLAQDPVDSANSVFQLKSTAEKLKFPITVKNNQYTDEDMFKLSFRLYIGVDAAALSSFPGTTLEVARRYYNTSNSLKQRAKSISFTENEVNRWLDCEIYTTALVDSREYVVFEAFDAGTYTFYFDDFEAVKTTGSISNLNVLLDSGHAKGTGTYLDAEGVTYTRWFAGVRTNSFAPTDTARPLLCFVPTESVPSAMCFAAIYKTFEGKTMLTNLVPITLDENNLITNDFSINLARAGIGTEGAYKMKYFMWGISGLNPLSDDVTFTVGAQNADAHMLDGKKVLFIGNSFTYYGKTVLEKKQSVLTQGDRNSDTGFFYQLCKENGANVSVTNWTWGGHNLGDTFFESCAAGKSCEGTNHLSYLTDKNYDYVIIQEGTQDGANAGYNITETVKDIMDIFKAENPNTKFLVLLHSNVYLSTNNHYDSLLAGLDELKSLGVTIVDWGKLVADVIGGTTSVPGATETYNKNSFIIKKSETDGYHPNMLSGYLTTLMTYSAITGESAVGQPYDFCNDPSLNAAFDFDAFCAEYYVYQDATTNFPAIFASEADMNGLQTLADRYLADGE
ncbi:MAG: hypothetical protein IJN74_04815 [Clostridia bacterium]|nr:hypothetical protein [Clostridia bacterium]